MISVIIPTYNRLEKLKKTLEAFRGQTLSRKDFEVIVVEDGGSDGTREFMGELQKTSDLNLKYIFLKHRGPGSARNRGVETASFPIVLFCGDDTRPDKKLLEIHAAHHKKQNSRAILGMALWDEGEEVTDFMRWLAPAGPQFHFNTIRDKNDAGFDHFYTCNISLKKKWLETENFDERFACAFEDVDLGLRLEKMGLKICFEPEAKVFHSHFYDEKSFGQRMQRVGRSAALLFEKYGKDKKTLRLLKIKYAPFCFFPGVKIFNRLSLILAKAQLIKMINPKYIWFWQVSADYSSGMLEEKSKHHEEKTDRVKEEMRKLKG